MRPPPRPSLAVLAIVALGLLPGPDARGDGTIVIVRHAEKPAQGLGQLSCRGLNRALALAPLLISRYGPPVAAYAPNPAQPKMDHGVAYAYVRPLATIEPLAVRAGLPLQLRWGEKEIDGLAGQLLSVPSGTQVVAWEHKQAEELARRLLSRLGADPNQVPQWENDDFDSILVIRIAAAGGARATFHHEHQGLDGMSEACPEPSAARGS